MRRSSHIERPLAVSTPAILLLCVILLLLAGCGKPKTPNAVLFILDTTRIDALGCYGGTVAKTPNIDALASRGALFRDAMAQNPYTLGSIATILTSLGPAIHRLRANSGYRLSDEAVTLAEVYKQAGYATAAFVSAIPISKEGGLDQGFDLYDDDFSTEYPIYDRQFEPIRESLQGAERRGDETTRRVLEWLDTGRPKGKPFFLVVHYFDPHQPYDPPPPFGTQYGELRYAAEVAFTDSQVGLVTRALDRLGLTDRTYIALVADHAEAFREHSEVGHGFLLYQTTMQVPWILAGPGVPNVPVEGMATLIDVGPTLLAACGLSIPETYEGRSVLSDLTARSGGGPAVLPERGIYMDTYFSRYYHEWSELIGWRRGDWKYVRGPKPELFHLGRDPYEVANLLTREETMTEKLSAELDDYLSRAGSRRMRASSAAPDAETLEKLKSLGYVGGAEPGEEFTEPGWDLGLPDPKDALIDWNKRQEANAFHRFSLACLQDDEYEDALRWADRTLAIKPDHLDALFVRCRALYGLGRDEEALSGYESLLKERAEDAEIWFGHGMVLHKLGRWQEAGSSYRRALELDPDHVQAHINMAVVLVQERRFEEALHHYEKVRELEPDRVAQLVDLARVYLLLERFDEGRRLLEESLEKDPQNEEGLFVLGLLLVEMGDAKGGRAVLEEYLKYHPDTPQATEVRQVLRSLEEGS